MVRDTSIDAYYEIRDNGLLSERRFEVYDCLYRIKEGTASEVFQEFRKVYGKNISSNGSGSRLSELRDMGVIQEKGTKVCPITGQTVILWTTTNQLPTKLNKKSAIYKYVCEECNNSFDTPRRIHFHNDDPCCGILTKWKKI